MLDGRSESLKIVQPSSWVLSLRLHFLEDAKISITVDDNLRTITSSQASDLRGRLYAKRMMLAPGLTEDWESGNIFWRWKIMYADLYTPEYLLRRPDLHQLS